MPDIRKNGLWEWQGRIGRLKYVLINMGLSILIILMSLMLERVVQPTSGGFWGVLILFLPILYVSTVAVIKRAHDCGLSGWYSLLSLIPVVNLGAGLYLLFAKGDDSANKYGISPNAEISPQPTSTVQASGRESPHVPSSLKKDSQDYSVSQGDQASSPLPTAYGASSITVAQHAPILAASVSMNDDDFYQIAGTEVREGNYDNGIWARAYAEADGDEPKTKAAYIRIRVERLRAEEVARAAEVEARNKELADAEMERQAIKEERMRLQGDIRATIEYWRLHEDAPEIIQLSSSMEFVNLIFAIRNKSKEEVAAAVLGDRRLLFAQNSEKKTALYFAVEEQRPAMVKKLLELGADPGVRRSAYTPSLIDVAKELTKNAQGEEIARLLQFQLEELNISIAPDEPQLMARYGITCDDNLYHFQDRHHISLVDAVNYAKLSSSPAK